MEDKRMATAVKAYKGMGMEGSIARWYDRTTRKDMPEVRQLAAPTAAMPPAGGSLLEVAPGPGFLSIELAKRGLQVRAVDISKTFVEIARRNAAEEGVAPRFELGNAAALPLEDAGVDFVVCRAAFKNFTEPVKALKEMRRVLRPGGAALLIDMRRDARMSEVKRYVDGLGGGLGRTTDRFLRHGLRGLDVVWSKLGLGGAPHSCGGRSASALCERVELDHAL